MEQETTVEAPSDRGSDEGGGGAEEVAATKQALGWPAEPTFLVPDEVRGFFKARAEEGRALRTAWEDRLARWRGADAERAAMWDAVWERSVPVDITDRLLEVAPSDAGGRLIRTPM